LDPDVLTGWNVVDFDLSFLSRVAARVKYPLRLGRDDGELRIRAAQGYFGSGSARIAGRLVLDGVDLLRGAFVRMDRYGLDAVARQVLGEGKALVGEADDRVEEILSNYRQDLPAFCRYARTDARLALEIVERLDLVNLAFVRSALTGMPPDRVAASIASFDFLYLSAMGRRGYVAPSVRSDDARAHAAQAGGHVLEPRVGVHDNVWVFDFKSLYPSLIRTFNIDPLSYVPTHAADGSAEESLIRLVDGAVFRRGSAILPEMLNRLFPQREAARRRGDTVASQAIKILMNSFYGVLGTPACRFYNPQIANAITGQGRHFLLWSKSWFETRGYAVLYGDTDSLFVGSGVEDPDEAHELAGRLVAEVDADLRAYIRQRWSLDSRLELEFEKMYRRLFLPSVRRGAAGARKRYAGLRWADGTETLEFVGMEVVRRDWTELAKRVQRELYQRLFADAPVEDYLAATVRAVRRGDLDELLVYRKGLRKRLDSYTASTPPHVAAARKSSRPPGRTISYIMTTTGPEPLDALTSEPDREHYIDRQIRPVAEPVLQTLGLSFSRVIGDDRQIGLF
jgi:DNA polymerase-2